MHPYRSKRNRCPTPPSSIAVLVSEGHRQFDLTSVQSINRVHLRSQTPPLWSIVSLDQKSVPSCMRSVQIPPNSEWIPLRVLHGTESYHVNDHVALRSQCCRAYSSNTNGERDTRVFISCRTKQLASMTLLTDDHVTEASMTP